MFLEADRMKALAITQDKLDNQRNAVQEERRLGVDNEPYGKAQIDLDNLSYDNFAYKHSTIGSMTDLDAASIDDVRDFFRIYYAPNNAVLTLVGDLRCRRTARKGKEIFRFDSVADDSRRPDLSEEAALRRTARSDLRSTGAFAANDLRVSHSAAETLRKTARLARFR